MPITPGLLPLPANASALAAEVSRTTAALERGGLSPARRLLAVERRRALIALDAVSLAGRP